VQGRATWRDYISDAMMMEVLALKEGLIIAKQKGVSEGMCRNRLPNGGAAVGQARYSEIGNQFNLG
jgi:hypothetical protein